VVAKAFYAAQMGPLLRPDINWISGIAFYLLFIVGLTFFAIAPALDQKSWMVALLYGGLFGLCCYATYDLTNLATLRNWPLALSFVDMAWGAVLAASVAVATYFIAFQLGI
jgi:uncharacterized membrane protein